MLRPILKINCHFNGEDREFDSLVDTGCDEAFILTRKQVEDIDLGDNKNIDPIWISTADEHEVPADLYYFDVELDGEMIPMTSVLVMDPKSYRNTPEEELNSIAIIGRELLNKFLAIFDGSKQKIVFKK